MAVGAGEVITRSFDKEKVALAALGAWVGTTAAWVICSIITFLAARLPRGRGVGSMTMGAGTGAAGVALTGSFLGAAALTGATCFEAGGVFGAALAGAGAAAFLGAGALGAATFLGTGLAAALADGLATGLLTGFFALEVLVTAVFAAGRAGFLDAGATADVDRPLPAAVAGFFLAVVVAGAFTKDLLSVPDTA